MHCRSGKDFVAGESMWISTVNSNRHEAYSSWKPHMHPFLLILFFHYYTCQIPSNLQIPSIAKLYYLAFVPRALVFEIFLVAMCYTSDSYACPCHHLTWNWFLMHSCKFSETKTAKHSGCLVRHKLKDKFRNWCLPCLSIHSIYIFTHCFHHHLKESADEKFIFLIHISLWHAIHDLPSINTYSFLPSAGNTQPEIIFKRNNLRIVLIILISLINFLFFKTHHRSCCAHNLFRVHNNFPELSGIFQKLPWFSTIF